jgi:hypothetical protein
MKLSEERLEQLIGWSIIIGITGNLLLCLNLYRQMGNLEYKVNQVESNLYNAVQSLSTEVYSLKNAKPHNRTGEFE